MIKYAPSIYIQQAEKQKISSISTFDEKYQHNKKFCAEIFYWNSHQTSNDKTWYTNGES